MPAYRAILDVSHLTQQQQRRKARTIKGLLQKHVPAIYRTGTLSRSAYCVLYEDLGLMVCGANAEYASYLNNRLKYAYILRACDKVIGAQFIKEIGAV